VDFLSPTIGETAPKSLSLQVCLSLGQAFALVDKALIFFVALPFFPRKSDGNNSVDLES